MSVGAALAEGRSQAGLTVFQVSQQTCIREAIIRGIERDDFSACGGDFYARGHIRSIARAVFLDPDALVQEYDATHVPDHVMTAAEIFEPATPIRIRERRAPNWTVAMVIVLALVIGYGVYRAVASGSGPTRTHDVAAQQHTTHRHHAVVHPSPSPSATEVANHGLIVELTASQDCWVEFTRPDGTFIVQAYIVGGSAKTWHFKHAVSMQIGNPAGITLTVNGQVVSQLDSYSQPVTLSFGPDKPLPTVAPSGTSGTSGSTGNSGSGGTSG